MVSAAQILDEVEKRHQISVAVIYPFMQGLREAAFPAPGKTVTLKSFIPDSGTEVGEQNGPDPPSLAGGGGRVSVAPFITVLPFTWLTFRKTEPGRDQDVAEIIGRAGYQTQVFCPPPPA